jgi:plasmid stability protein
MRQMTVRAIPDEAFAKLKARAKDEGLSAEALVRRMILEEARRPSRLSFEEALKRMDELRAMTPPGEAVDSTSLIREFRDKGYQDDEDD